MQVKKTIKNKNAPAKIKSEPTDEQSFVVPIMLFSKNTDAKKQPRERADTQLCVALITLFSKNTGSQKQPRYYSTPCNSQINANLPFYAVKK